MLNVRELKAPIEEIRKYSENLWVFRFGVSGSALGFVPGQFVMLSIPGLADKNGRKIAKAYSISSSPGQPFVELCIVHYQNGALSPTLFGKKVGDVVTLTGPYGVFKLNEPVKPGTVFIAGGTGLAPLICMLRYLYGSGCREPLWLFYSVSEPGLFLFRDELLGYGKSNNLRLVASTSRPDADWQFEKGRVTETFQKYAAEIPKDSQFYLCGPPLMVTDTVKMLEQLGYKKENVHKEQW